MAHDWLLVETLGDEPVVVAQGRQLKNMVPLSAFLRRSPHLAAITDAVAQTVRTGTGLSRAVPNTDRVVRTEPVTMSDGVVHGVQLWTGPAAVDIPERPVPGPLVWDLTTGMATDTPQSLSNSGMDPAVEPTHGRTFAEDLPRKELVPNETKVLSLAINCDPGERICSMWDVTDQRGNLISVGFVARADLETTPDGSRHMISRAMNWRGDRQGPAVASDYLGQRILAGLAQPGIHRALVDINNWTLLKWLDDPCPYYDWRQPGDEVVHPGDEPLTKAMTAEFVDGPTSRVLRLKGKNGGWVRIHVTVNRIQLDAKTIAGLISLRPPTPAELVDAELTS
ncbi:MAG: DUF5593 domain-containing protein [Mycobacteriaceae bacterium]|nr:DUF5593 domain-containing protein [Mycobacteriaceae bacterium]MBV9638548.1 DUF5593 domain-containing protein [Mycobacteriaceae bacterium]